MTYLLLQLFWTFFVIGIFNFGGGGSMISIIQAQVVAQKHWITEETFANIVAISQTTPGPIGVNTATYVGYEVMNDAGYSNLVAVLGSASCTLAIVLPSFIIFFLLMKVYSKYHGSRVFSTVMTVLRPATAGLIGAAALVLMFHLSMDGGLQVSVIEENFPDWKSWVMGGAAFALTMWTRISPITIILCAGVAGLLIY